MGVKREWAARRWETASQKTAARIEQARRIAKKESQCCFVSGVPPIAAAPFPAASPGWLRLAGVAAQVLLRLQCIVKLSSHAPGAFLGE